MANKKNGKKVCKQCQQMRLIMIFVSVAAILLLTMASG